MKRTEQVCEYSAAHRQGAYQRRQRDELVRLRKLVG